MSKCKDSVLGEQCGSVALCGKGTTTKVANLYHKVQSSHSPTATPRILEEESRAQGKNQSTLESKNLDSSLSLSLPAVIAASLVKSQCLKPAKRSCLKTQSIQSGLDASF